MSNADTVTIDLAAFLLTQRRERYPVAVVHGLPFAGKSTFARRLAQRDGFGYLDVLNEVSERPNLAGAIDRFDVAALRMLIVEYASNAGVDVLLVDELDFLIPTWAGDLAPFQEMVRRLRHPEKQVAFGFFLQTRPAVEQWQLLNAARVSCVLPFETIKPL
jgi:hypothetical protein